MHILRAVRRKISDCLLKWKNEPGHKPLVLKGCRQTGKTYSLKEFGRTEYSKMIYINFEERPDLRRMFNENLSSKDLIARMEVVFGIKIVPRKSLVILDEVQNCSAAYSSLKSFAQQNDVDVAASGSFLGVKLDEGDPHLSPMGYVETKTLHPMDFEEFLWGMGFDEDLTGRIRSSVETLTPMDDFINEQINQLYKAYLAVGGMPEAVKAYCKTSRYMEARKCLEGIVGIFRSDAGSYSRRNSLSKIIACLEYIPRQLAGGSRHFFYSEVERKRGYGKRNYETALTWLEGTGLTGYCRLLEGLEPPLSARASDDRFKAYMSDTGVLATMMEGADIESLIYGDPFVDNGMFMENGVASALMKKGYPLYYYEGPGSSKEIEFVIVMGGRVSLIEVKPGRRRPSTLMSSLIGEGRGIRGFKVVDGNMSVGPGGVVYLPLYAASFLPEPDVPETAAFDVEGLKRMMSESEGGIIPRRTTT